MRDQDFISLTSKREAMKAIKFYNRKKTYKRKREKAREKERKACDIEKKREKREQSCYKYYYSTNYF